MNHGAPASADDVFINCPFDSDYQRIFEAIVFVVFACGFRARSALELDDGGQSRIEKLFSIIEQSRYGIHDLCRTQLDPVHGLPRFNMPLELGLFLGAKRYGAKPQRNKRCLILDVERYRYQRFISDLAGMDIRAHDNDPLVGIACVRDWLANVSRRRLPGSQRLIEIYQQFEADKPAIVAAAGIDPDRIPYVDFEIMITTWLVDSPA